MNPTQPTTQTAPVNPMTDQDTKWMNQHVPPSIRRHFFDFLGPQIIAKSFWIPLQPKNPPALLGFDFEVGRDKVVISVHTEFVTERHSPKQETYHSLSARQTFTFSNQQILDKEHIAAVENDPSFPESFLDSQRLLKAELRLGSALNQVRLLQALSKSDQPLDTIMSRVNEIRESTLLRQ